VQALTAEQVLRIWERGEGRSANERAALLFACARPEAPPSVLASATLGERESELLELRIRTFGRRLESIDVCPACGTKVEIVIDADDLLSRNRGPAAAQRAGEHRLDLQLEDGGWRIVFRLPTGADLAALESCEPARAPMLLLERCVMSADSADGPVSAGQLPDEVQARVAAAMGELDPAADITIVMSCPACLREWQVCLDVGAFVWSELAAHARQLLWEVHELAERYGWSESEIIRMSAHRRRAYRERIWE
jgi:hypothetical protein